MHHSGFLVGRKKRPVRRSGHLKHHFDLDQSGALKQYRNASSRPKKRGNPTGTARGASGLAVTVDPDQCRFSLAFGVRSTSLLIAFTWIVVQSLEDVAAQLHFQ